MKDLTKLQTGEQALVLAVDVDEKLVGRLKAFNIYCGAKLRLLQRTFFGATLLVEADGIRVGIRRSLAQKIYVSPSGEEGK